LGFEVYAKVVRDGIDPGREFGLCAELTEVEKNLEEYLLRCIPCEMFVFQQKDAFAINLGGIPPVKHREIPRVFGVEIFLNDLQIFFFRKAVRSH